MKFCPIFAWYDLWVGIFWDSKKRRLYVFPVPMLGFYIQFALWEAGSLGNLTARRHNITGVVDFQIWPAGHPRAGDSPEGYWCEANSYNWDKFVPAKEGKS